MLLFALGWSPTFRWSDNRLKPELQCEDHNLNQSSLDRSTIREPASDLGVCLEIRRGRTEKPLRPMLDERFLIGSGADCDLRLGGDDIPPLHSLMHFDGADLWLEVIALEPPLKVNGQTVKTVLLRNGDRLEVSSFDFVVRHDRLHPRVDAAHAAPESEHQPPHVEFEASFPLDELALLGTEELVDHLDREMRLIERFERRRTLGANALMQAIRQRAARITTAKNDADSSLPSTPKEDLSNADSRADRSAAGDLSMDLERTIEQLQVSIRQLEQRSDRLIRREQAYNDAALTLIEVQERMAAQLEFLQRQVVELRQGPTTEVRRARASA